MIQTGTKTTFMGYRTKKPWFEKHKWFFRETQIERYTSITALWSHKPMICAGKWSTFYYNLWCYKVSVFFFGSRSCQTESILLRSVVHVSVVVIGLQKHFNTNGWLVAVTLWVHRLFGMLLKMLVSVCNRIVSCDLLRHYYLLSSSCNVCALLKRSVLFSYLACVMCWGWCYFAFFLLY